jgi:riboflavin synthase
MNNRLGDIPSWDVESLNDDEGPFSDVEMGQVNEEQLSHMTRFFEEVETIKSGIKAIRDASAKITRLGDETIRATTTEKEQSLSKKLKPIVDKTNKQAKRMKNLLEVLNEETKKLKEEGTLLSSDERYVTLSFSGKE